MGRRLFLIGSLGLLFLEGVDLQKLKVIWALGTWKGVVICVFVASLVIVVKIWRFIVSSSAC